MNDILEGIKNANLNLPAGKIEQGRYQGHSGGSF